MHQNEWFQVWFFKNVSGEGLTELYYSVWGSIRFRTRWESSNYSATMYCSCSNLGSRMGGSTEYIFWCIRYTTPLKPLLKSGQRLWVGVYLDHHVGTCFWKKAILSRLNKHYFEMYQTRWKISGNFLDLLGENLDFRFNYTYSKCMVSTFKYEFSKFFWGGTHRAPSPDPLPALNLRLCRLFSGALHPRFGLRPQFTPPTCLITPLPTEGY